MERRMTLMRAFLAITIAVSFGAAPSLAGQDETTVYLSLEQAPQSLFPGAQIERKDVPSTHEFQEKLKAKLGRVTPTVWEPLYRTFRATQDNKTVGYAVVVDEIGKVNPFTLIVAATPEFRVRDVAVMVYREPRGGEITQKRFLAQYKGKGSGDPILLDRDIVGISGATLSVIGANRAVHKALSVLELVYR
jgi:FMN-binding domain